MDIMKKLFSLLAILSLEFISCSKDNPQDNPNAYVENGNYLGGGVLIDGVVWAPVNCGYDAEKYPYGLLYQFGRKYGQGYNDENYQDATYPIGNMLKMELLDNMEDGSLEANKDNFYYMQKSHYQSWYVINDASEVKGLKLWNSGTDSNPIKTKYDPCPDGWRVPTDKELQSLDPFLSSGNIDDKTSKSTKDSKGMFGIWFSGNKKYVNGMDNAIFLPAAGFRRGFSDGAGVCRGLRGYYASSKLDEDDVKKRNVHLCFDDIRETNLFVDLTHPSHGQSVRCVKE